MHKLTIMLSTAVVVATSAATLIATQSPAAGATRCLPGARAHHRCYYDRGSPVTNRGNLNEHGDKGDTGSVNTDKGGSSGGGASSTSGAADKGGGDKGGGGGGGGGGGKGGK